MMWQLAHFVGNSSVWVGKIATFRGYLTLLSIVLVGYYGWKNVISGWWRRRARLIKFASTMSGPATVPIIGNALIFACKAEDTLDRIIDVGTQYESPFRVWIGPKLYIVITEPRDYEVILGSGKAVYKDPIYRMLEPLLGKGMATNSGPEQKARRKLILPIVNNNKSLAIHLKYFDRQSRTCADLLEREIGRGEFDISPYMVNLTIDIVLETIFGTPGTTQKDDYKDLNYWIDRTVEVTHSRMVKLWLYWDKLFFLTKLGDEYRKGIDAIHGFLDRSIDQKKKDHCAYKRGEGDLERSRITLLEKLIVHSEQFNDIDDDAIHHELYTVFLASQDTMAGTVAFALLMMSIHPDVQDKVREEVNSVLGNESITETHLSKLKYVEMVIRETLRLFPPVALFVRELRGDIALDTCTLPEGCGVIMAPFLTHRSPKFWEEPEKFNPERFLPEKSVGRHQYAYVSFSGGPRSCIGQKFAIMCMKTMIVNIVQRYRFSSTEKMENIRLKTDISIRSCNGYKLSITKLNQNESVE